MILLIVIVIIITINVIDIRFDEAGIASETIDTNMVYESKAVIESPLCKMRRLSHPLPGKNGKLLGKT
jgi:hypothetical protein